MKLKSPAFDPNQRIPKESSGEGRDISPPLEWSDVPEGTREFALVCEDPDAPKSHGPDHPFVHWVIYNISPSVTMLPDGITAIERIEVPVRADQGRNSFGNIGYGGPLPPVGHGVHRYVFTLFALDAELGLPPGAARDELLEAMKGHVLASAQLIGTYVREPTKEAA